MRVQRTLIGGAFVAVSLATLALISCVGDDASTSTTPSGQGGDGAGGGPQIGPDGAVICTPVPEKCGNKIDDNCDGVVDEGCDCSNVPEGTSRSCGQAGPGTCKLGTQLCQNSSWTECTGVGPLDKEATCDGKDENCDGVVDEGLTIVCLHDVDHDGYPSATDKKSVCPDPTAAGAPRYGCPVDYIRDTQSPGNDCNDNDPSIKPGVAEHCDAIDWDCNGQPRNSCPSATETYGAATTSGLYGYAAMVGGCGTQTYATSSTSCTGGAVSLGGFWSGPFTAPTQVQLGCKDGIINESVTNPEYTYTLAGTGATTMSPLTGPGRADDVAGLGSCNTGDWVIVGSPGTELEFAL